MNQKAVPLGNLCNLVGGGTPSKSNAKYYSGEIPWATVRDLNVDVINHTEHSITQEGLNSSASNIIPKGNVILASRVGLGKVCLAGIDVAINQDLRGVIPKRPDKISSRYLYWWLKSVSPQIIAAGKGATVQGVTLPFLNSLAFPLIPIEWQRHTAAILDEALQAIAKAMTNTERNRANARELFQSELDTVFQRLSCGLKSKLDALIDITHGYAFDGEEFGKSEDLTRPIVLTPGNYDENATLHFLPKNTKRFTGRVDPAYLFKLADLTVVMTDLSSKMKILGKPAFIDRDNILHNQRIGRVVFKNTQLQPRYLYYFLRTQAALQAVKESATGTMVKHTAPKRILSNSIPLPKTEDQIDIVHKLDAISFASLELEATYQNKMAMLSGLKSGILERAFSGELFPRPSSALEVAAE